MSDDKLQTELNELKQTIASLQKYMTGPQLEAALKPLLERKADLEATLTGSGVITQGSVLAAGERGVVGSAAGGHIITGSGNSIRHIINVYQVQGGAQSDEGTLRRQIASYLTWMRDQHGKIELRGIKREGQQVVQLDLEDIYVPLEAEIFHSVETDRPMRKRALKDDGGSGFAGERRRIELDRVLQLGRRVVVTGGPGSGKTTVMLHLAWTLTQALAADDPALATEKLGLTEDLPLPILLPLSAYALHLRNLPANAKPEEKTLAAFISRYQIEKQTSFELPPDFFQQLLRSGRAVILLLDGLDEVPNEAERVQVRSAIEDLVIGRDNLRAVVTCRMAAYKERTALGKGFQEVRVQLLDEDHLNALVGQAYTYLYHHDPQAQKDKTNELLSGIRKLEQERQVRFGDEVEPLVASPLMVRMLLVVHYSERRLPDQRAELYMKATDAMLLPEYAPDETVADQIGGLVGGSREVHRELAQHLAFAMHERGEAQGREISEDDLRTILHKHPLYANLTDDFIALTRLRGTLLEERLGAYRFLHLAFQEFLAARYLAEIVRSEAGVAGIARFFADGPILDSWWREPALLTVGYLTITSPQTAQLLLRHLAGLGGDRLQDDATASERSADIQLASAEAAAIAALEWPGLSEALSIALAGRLGGFFRTSNRLIRAKPVWRAAAGAALARLGDPRQGVSTLNQMEFCYVPAGPFRMGSPGDDDLAYDDEKPLHQHELAYGYWLARYPVTVAQYRAYVEASGRHPQVQDSLRDPANHPVVYVSWREALDFCNWLTNRWQEQGFLSTGWAARLPSEAEWEKGARGGLMIPAASLVLPVGELSVKLEPEMQQNPAPGRRFPWGGDEPDPGRMNFDQTGINATNTVGCFPNGASPYGCEEMSGNVWEWTRSLWGKGLSEPDYKYPYDPNDGRENLKAGEDVRRVVRGGAFLDVHLGVRCAARHGHVPYLRRDLIGFRVLVSPI